MENKIKPLNFTNIFYLAAFLISAIALCFVDNINISFLNIDLYYNKVNGAFLLITNMSVFLYGILTKNSNKYSFRQHLTPSILLVLINLFIVSENILIALFLLFLIFLVSYIVNRSKYIFSLDCIALFTAFVFISLGFLRYFVLNEITLTYSAIEQYQYKIDDNALKYAMYGLLIVIFRLFGFLPFSLKVKNSCATVFNLITYYSMGCILLFKTYSLFEYFFYQSQKIIAIYLVLNILYFTFIQFKSKSFTDFIKHTISANIIVGIFGLFIYNESGLVSFIYYSLILLSSYIFGFIIFNIIKRKMGSCAFANLKKISNNDKLIKFFIFATFLNFAKILISPLFFASVYSFLNIFLIDKSCLFMSLVPYILFLCVFLSTVNSFATLNKVLIYPSEPLKVFRLSSKQKIILSLSILILFLTGLSAVFIINGYMNIISNGNV